MFKAGSVARHKPASLSISAPNASKQLMKTAQAADGIRVVQAGADAQAVDPQPAVTVLPVTAEGAAAAASAAAAQQAATAAEAGAEAQQAAEIQAAAADPATGTEAAVVQAGTQSLPGIEQPQEQAAGDAAAGAATQQSQGEVLPVEDFTSKTRQVPLKSSFKKQCNLQTIAGTALSKGLNCQPAGHALSVEASIPLPASMQSHPSVSRAAELLHNREIAFSSCEWVLTLSPCTELALHETSSHKCSTHIAPCLGPLC